MQLDCLFYNIASLWMLVLILDLFAEKMLDGFDLFCSYCKRFDGLLTGFNNGAYSGFLRLPKYMHWMEWITV